MRVFECVNRSNYALYVLAESQQAAERMVLGLGHVRKAANLTISDVTDRFRDKVPDLLSGSRSGTVCFCGFMVTFQEALAGVKRPGGEWRLIERDADGRPLQ